jgi:hypothetical protein
MFPYEREYFPPVVEISQSMEKICNQMADGECFPFSYEAEYFFPKY